MRVARTVVLTPGQKEALEARTRARSASARSVERARIVLMAALAVTGTPPFSIFQSEFTILRAGFAAQRTGAVVLFVGLTFAIFCGFFYHVARMVLGAPGDLPRGEPSRWKTYPVIALTVILMLLGFWLPPPIYDLLGAAANILVVQP